MVLHLAWFISISNHANVKTLYWCWSSDDSFILFINLHQWSYCNDKEIIRDISTTKKLLKEVSSRKGIPISVWGTRSEWGSDDWCHHNLLVDKSYPCNYFSQLYFCCFVFNINCYIAHQYLGMSEEGKSQNKRQHF